MSESSHQPLLETAYLRSVWATDFEEFNTSSESAELLKRLSLWAEKDWQKETAAEATFIDVFFRKTWGYRGSGEVEKEKGYTMRPQFPVRGAGQKGGTGEADVALGIFGGVTDIPQVLGEFKDDRSGLDKPQTNRPNSRSPVEQCLDYLREARSGLISKILPTWAIVTDMNEFRLYRYGNKAQYQRFVIQTIPGDTALPLIGDGDDAQFQRFLFARMFHTDWLITKSGKSDLERLLSDQIVHEKNLEAEFYQEYKTYREVLYRELRKHNPKYEAEDRLRQLVNLTQRILDRLLFILYCEDMGRVLRFPRNVLHDVLRDLSRSKYFNTEGNEAWTSIKSLFEAMRTGGPFGDERINQFNGSLFDHDPEMDELRVPNSVFCAKNQGESASQILAYPETLLFLSAKYNFGISDDGSGRTLTLTAMGRIFEQSITDLEVMEARATGRQSIVELSKRKRDGVYYTPEWVTHYIVEETVGLRLAEIRDELGFERFSDITDEDIAANRSDRRKAPKVQKYVDALNDYSKRLDALKVVDPACGSGAFLIQAFRYLYGQRQWVAAELERIVGMRRLFDTHEAMRAVLSNNLYGVDINPESVELTRLALWLHTALPNRPLTSLDRNISGVGILSSPTISTSNSGSTRSCSRKPIGSGSTPSTGTRPSPKCSTAAIRDSTA